MTVRTIAAASALALAATTLASGAASPADRAQESYANGRTSPQHVAVTRARDLAEGTFGRSLDITKCRVRTFDGERFFAARCRVSDTTGNRVAIVAGRFHEDGSPRSFRVRLAISAATANPGA